MNDVNVIDRHGTLGEDTLISHSDPAHNHPSKTQAVKNYATELLNALIKESSWVWATIKVEPNQFIHIKRERTQDRRLRDIRIVEGDTTENHKKILRGLAQRSLALQAVKSGYLNVDKLYEKVKNGNPKGGRHGRTVLFVVDELDIDHNSKDQDFAVRATREGMKQLLMERFLGDRLKEMLQKTLSETPNGVGKERLEEMLGDMKNCQRAPGISVFTALAVRPFRYLKYGEFEKFAGYLLESHAMASSIQMVMSSDCHHPLILVGHLIQKATNWLERVQNHYDGE